LTPITSRAPQVLGLNSFFVALWVGSALPFLYAPDPVEGDA
jgi:hypothetical protein